MNLNFIHPRALCESNSVGANTRIQAFTRVLAGAVIGSNCDIGTHVAIENDVVLGDGVLIKGGAQLCDGLRVGDNVFIGPNATFTNDKYPRGNFEQTHVLFTHLEAGVSIGAHAIILPNVRIGAGAMVGAGAVVTRSVPPRAIVVGNPARIIGYSDALKEEEVPTQASTFPSTLQLRIQGVVVHKLKEVKDLRGNLSVAEFGEQIPFRPSRYFIVRDVPGKHIRGEHAHLVCEQFLVCVNGGLSVVVDDGWQREELVLDAPTKGLYIPPLVWGIQYKYTPDAVLLVFASHPYESTDYIRDYEQFIAIAKSSTADRCREAA